MKNWKKTKEHMMQNKVESDWIGDSDMTQEEIEQMMNKIEESAKGIKVPESLEPEEVKRKLREKRRTYPLRRWTEVAAAAILVVTIGATGIYGMSTKYGENVDRSKNDRVEQKLEDAEIEMNIEAAGIDQPVPKTQVVGDYRLAKSYEDVFAALETQTSEENYLLEDMAGGFVNGAVIKSEITEKESRDMAEESGSSIKDNGAGIEAVEDLAKESESSTDKDFSKTNIQEEGVDESDFIKNDGNYLYIQTEYKVNVIDIRGKKMKQAAVFTPEMGASDAIMDMYIDGDRLLLILQRREVSMEDTQSQKYSMESEDIAYVSEYYMNSDTNMELQTYDITDRNKVKLLGTVNQEGSYYDSRKVGDYVYLFSRKDAYAYQMRKTVEGFGDDRESMIPEINGEKVSADCIYLQDHASSEMIISSVCVTEPSKTVDQMVLLNRYANIYMSTEAIYLYTGDYEWTDDSSRSFTDIAKFAYKNGKMSGVGAANLRGEIQDVFAISESNGILRVLTTDWAGNASKNQLYLMDKNMKMLGSLTDIAVGEEIYAARYIGDIAYFITYHNTDPLFAVDISNPASPKMLGQVEITGFSDYLHPYGEGLLLGIGYETDPETSERLGVKLVMFDIGNPTKPKVLDSIVFDGNYCSAANHYKSALVSAAKNLIGFEVTDWSQDDGDRISYKLYGWENEKFVKRLSKKIDSRDCWDESTVRGQYAGDKFYLVSQKGAGYIIQTFDMKADYEKLDEMMIE